jgi:alginate O-acetyltransferase complex protein AlgI
MLVLYRAVPIHRYLTEWFGTPGKWLSIFITFHIVCFGWILFRAQTTTVLPLLSSIPELWTANNLYLFQTFGRGVLFLGAITLITDYIGYRKQGEFSDLFKSMHPYVGAVVVACCYFAIMVFGKREGAQFIYFQF